MQEITLCQDWLILCSLMSKHNWSILGISLDIVGFLVIVRAANKLINFRASTSAKAVFTVGSTLRYELARTLICQQYPNIKPRAFEDRIGVPLDHLFTESPQINIPNDPELISFMNEPNFEETTALAKKLITPLYPSTADEPTLKHAINLAALYREVLGFHLKTQHAQKSVDSWDKKMLALGAVLIVLGFFLQIVGAFPCPIDQLPDL